LPLFSIDVAALIKFVSYTILIAALRSRVNAV